MDFRFRPGLLGDPTVAFGNNHYSQANMGFCASGNVNLSSCHPELFGGRSGNSGCGGFQPLTPNNMMMCSRQPHPLNMAGGLIHQNVSIGQNQWNGRAQNNMGVARMVNDSRCSAMNWSQGNFSCIQMNHMNNMPWFPMSQNGIKPVMLPNSSQNPHANQNSSHRMMMIQQQNFGGNYVHDSPKMMMCQQQWFDRANGMSPDNQVSGHKPMALHNTRFGQGQAGHDNMENTKQSTSDCPTFLNRNIHRLTYRDSSGYQSQGVHCSREEVQVEKVVTRRTYTGTLRRSRVKKEDKACDEETVTVHTRKTVFRQTPFQEVFEYNHNSSIPSSDVRPVSRCRESRDTNSRGDKMSRVAQNGVHTVNDQMDGSLDETCRNCNCISNAKTLVTEYHHKKCHSKNDLPTKTSDNQDSNTDGWPQNELKSEGSLSDSAENSVEKREDKSFVRGLDRHRRSRLDRWIESTVKDKRLAEVIQSRPDSLERIPSDPENISLSLHHVRREKRNHTEGKSNENRLQLDSKTVKGKQTPNIIKEHGRILSPNDKYSQIRSKRNSTSPSSHVNLSEKSHLRQSSQHGGRRSYPVLTPENNPYHRRTESRHHRNTTEKSHSSDVMSSKGRRHKSSDAVPSVQCGEVTRSSRQANPIRTSAARSCSLRRTSESHSSHEDNRLENKISVDQMYSEKRLKGCYPTLRDRREMRDSFHVTDKIRCSDPIVTEKNRQGCDEKRLHRDTTKKGPSTVNRRHSDPIVASTKLPRHQQRNEHVDFSPLYRTDIGHTSHSKRTVVLVRCPQKSAKNIKINDRKTCEKQIETMSPLELRKKNMKTLKFQDFESLKKESNDNRPGFSFLKPKQTQQHNSKSPPKFWSSEYLKYVTSRNTHRNPSYNDSETRLPKLKSSRCFLPRSVSVGRVATKLQGAKGKVTKAANHTKNRQPVDQDVLFTPDPVTVVMRNKVSLDKPKDESLKDILPTGLTALPSLLENSSVVSDSHLSTLSDKKRLHSQADVTKPKESEHSSVASDSLPSPTLKETHCLHSQTEAHKHKEDHKAVGSGLKITLIRGVKPSSISPSENIKGCEPKSIPASRRTNPRTCVSARKHVVSPILSGEKKHARKSRSLDCSPVDVRKEGQDQVQKRMTRKGLADRFSLLLTSPLSPTDSFTTKTKSRDQTECNRESLQSQLKSIPREATTPLCHSRASVNRFKSPSGHVNPSPSKLTATPCHTKSPLKLLKIPLHQVKTLPSKVKKCDTLSPLTHQMRHIKVAPGQIKSPSIEARSPLSLIKSPVSEGKHFKVIPSQIKHTSSHAESHFIEARSPLSLIKSPVSEGKHFKVIPSQIKHTSSHAESPSIEARSPLGLIKSPVSKSKTFVTPSTRTLERKVCQKKRNLQSRVAPTVDWTPLKMSTSRLRDQQKKSIKEDLTLCSHTKCPTPLNLAVTKKGTTKVMTSECGDNQVDLTPPTHKEVSPESPQSAQMFHTLSPTNGPGVTPINLGQELRKRTLTPLGSTLSPTSSTSVSPSVSPTPSSGQRWSQMVSTYSLTHTDSVTPTMLSESLTSATSSPTSATTPGVTPLVPEQTGCVYRKHVPSPRLEVDTGSTPETEKSLSTPDTKTTTQRSGNEGRSHCTDDDHMPRNSSDHEGNGEDNPRNNSDNVSEGDLNVSDILPEIRTHSGNKLKFTSIKKDGFQKPSCSSSHHGDNSNGTVISCLEDMNSTATRRCVKQGNHGAYQKGLVVSSEDQIRTEGAFDVSHKVMLRKRLSVDKLPSDVDAHCSFKKAKLSDSDAVTVRRGGEDPLTRDQISCEDVTLDVDEHTSCDSLWRTDVEDLGQVVELENLDSSDVTMTEVSTVSNDTLIDEGRCSVRANSEGKHRRGYKKKLIAAKDYYLRNKRNRDEKKRSSVSMCDATANHRYSRKKISSSGSENVISKSKCTCKAGRRNCRGRHSNKCEVSKRREQSSEGSDNKHHRGSSVRKSVDLVDMHRRKYKDRTSKSSSVSNALKPRSQAMKSHGKKKSKYDSRVAAEKENTHRITFNIIQGDQLTQPRLRLRKCVYCGTFCTRLTHIMREHVTVVHPHKCLTCHVAFKNKLEARAHKLTQHLKEVHHCMLCHKVLMSRPRYKRHIQSKSHMRLMEAQREALGAICRAFFQGGQEDFSETLKKVQSQETGLWNPERECGKKALPTSGDEPATPPKPAPNLSHLRHFYYDNPELGQMVKKFEEFSPAQNLVLGSTDPSAVSYADPQSDVFFFPLPQVQDSESWTLTTETESETEISTQITVQDRDLLDLSLSEALGTAISEWQDPLPSGRVSNNLGISDVYSREDQLISSNRADIEVMSIDSSEQHPRYMSCGNGDQSHSDTYLYQTDTEAFTDSATESSVVDLDDAHRMFQLMSLPKRSQGSVQSAGPVSLASTSTKMPSGVDASTRLSSSHSCPVFLPREIEIGLTTDVKVITGQIGDSTVCPNDQSRSVATHSVEISAAVENCLAFGNSIVVDPQLGNTDMISSANTESNQKEVYRLENRDNPVCFNMTNMDSVDTGPPVPLMLPAITSTSDRSNTCVDKQHLDSLTSDDPQQSRSSLASDTDHPCSLISPSGECPVTELSIPDCPVRKPSTPSITSNISQPLPLKLPAIPSAILPSHQCNVRLLCDYTDSSDDESSAVEDCSVSQDKKITGYSSKGQNGVDTEVTENQIQVDQNEKSGQSTVDDDESESLVKSRQSRDSMGVEVTKNQVHLDQDERHSSVPGSIDDSRPLNLAWSKQSKDRSGVEVTENQVQLDQDERCTSVPGSIDDGRPGSLVWPKQTRGSSGVEVTENQVQLDQDERHSSVPGSVDDGRPLSLLRSKQTTHTSLLHNSADAEVTDYLLQTHPDSKTSCSIEFSDVKEVDVSEECRLKAEFCLLLKEIAEDEKYLGTV